MSLPADEEIVISGISGKFPECDNMAEFQEKLFEGESMISSDDRRWRPGMLSAPPYSGFLKDISRLDAGFFGLSSRHADVMAPEARMLLEMTYEAIVDAGVNPTSIRGSKTGVYVAMSANETENYWAANPHIFNHYCLYGSVRSFVANRITYTYDFTGPSLVIDTACSSSVYVLEAAFTAMKSGNCDAAIVAGCNIQLNPGVSGEFFKVGTVTGDGKCKPFDAEANGYIRSDALVVLFLQKASVARRVYATVVQVKTNADGFKVEGSTFPSQRMQTQLMHDVYRHAGVEPRTVCFMEAHGTGTKVGDPVEAAAIARVFCEDRKSPLLIGSVKSNMGHSEASSGLCSIAKAILAMETGLIPPNINYNSPNPRIPAITDGRLKVVVEKTPLQGEFVAINSFGLGGSNGHMLLRRNKVIHGEGEPKTSRMPRIVGVAGRTEEAVHTLLSEIEARPNDVGFIALLHGVFDETIPNLRFRGYTVVGGEKIQREISELPTQKGRPVWFVFSGMGSQWPTMGRDFLEIPVFRTAIEKCSKALNPKGIDLYDILTNPRDTVYDDVINTFVGVAAIQVGLVDTLSSLNIKPDGIVGHSLGELGCAYADGGLTAEQTVLAAYARGKATAETKMIRGAMAAVGMSPEEAKSYLPSEVDVACHNSSTLSTISGPKGIVDEVLQDLHAKGVFAKQVRVSDVAFHSRYIAQAGSKVLQILKEVIPLPKRRSPKWLSTCVPEQEWDSPGAQLCSAEYFTRNLLSPVLFREACYHIPDSAILVEIAPHGLLQAVLRRSFSPSTLSVSLAKREHPNNLEVFTTALGRLYNAGVQPRLSELYPKMQFPVRRGTSMISPLIKWDHEQQWGVPRFYEVSGKVIQHMVQVDISREDNAFYKGHKIDGRILFPATGYLVLVWKMLASLRTARFEDLSVIFEDVQFHRVTILPNKGAVYFELELIQASGRFEITESNETVATGVIRVVDDVDKEKLDLPKASPGPQELIVSRNDIYKELRLRGYQYGGDFQGLLKATVDGRYGEVQATSNWTVLLDTALHLTLFQDHIRRMYLPTRLQRVSIDPRRHQALTAVGNALPVHVHADIRTLQCGGVEVRGLEGIPVTQHPPQMDPLLEKMEFVSYISRVSQFDVALSLCLQVVAENANSRRLKILERCNSPDDILATRIARIMEDIPLIQADLTVVSDNILDVPSSGQEIKFKLVKEDGNQESHLLVVSDVECLEKPKPGLFLLAKVGSNADETKMATRLNMLLLCSFTDEGSKLILLKEAPTLPTPSIIQLTSCGEFSWLSELRQQMKMSSDSQKRILLVAENDQLSGIVGLVNCLRQEPGGQNIRCVFLREKNFPAFSTAHSSFKDQLAKDLVMNVYQDGAWGSFRHTKLDLPALVPVEHAYINTLSRGDLSALSFIQGPLSMRRSDMDSGKKLCQVYFAALNFHDVMLATGRIPEEIVSEDPADQDCILGLEFSGRDPAGKRLMGLVFPKGLATSVIADPVFTWEVPDGWSLEDAATVPIVYCTAYYSLVMRGNLQQSESVLIHAGSGGVGQAAIAIVLHYGCKVFTTVGTPEKRAFLLKRFPQLTESSIANSRDCSFEQHVLRETGGRGVDVVLNSLAEDKLQASLRCLAVQGRFLEIGRYDLAKNNPFGMGVLLRNTAVHGIQMDHIDNKGHNLLAAKQLVDLMNSGIKLGVVKPLPRTVFEGTNMEEAFRYMAAGRHIGKVVLKMRDEEAGPTVKSKTKYFDSLPRVYFKSSALYIITGGLGGLGLEMAEWMVRRGAKNLLLTSRRGVRSGYQSLCLHRWRNLGIRVEIATRDMSSVEEVTRVLLSAKKNGDIRGIFHLAVVLKDAFLENQTEQTFRDTWEPKMAVARSLDKASRDLCPNLEHFVVFSSIVCGRGNAGQSNYAMANSALERMCEDRRKAGLPALAIQWGPIADVGIVAENAEVSDATKKLGIVPQSIGSCLDTMDRLLGTRSPVVASTVLAKEKNKDAVKIDLVQAVSKILDVEDLRKVDPSMKLIDLGLDSLMLVEIRTGLERYFDLVLSPQEIRSLTVAKLLDLEKTRTTEKVARTKDSKLPLFWNLLLESDSVLPSEPLVAMRSDTASETAVFLVHPVDGTVRSLETLASRLQCTVYGLQATQEVIFLSLEDVAKSYLKHMAGVKSGGPYFIAGYSFGAAIAFEMALQLERAGHEVSLFSLDGIPLKGAEASVTEASYIVLETFLSYFLPADLTKKSMEDIVALPSWSEQLNNALNLVSDKSSHPRAKLRLVIDMCRRKLAEVFAYKPSGKFQGRVFAYRARDSEVIKKDDGFATSFQKLCDQPIKETEILGDHLSFLQSEGCVELAEHLNKILNNSDTS